MFDAGEWCTPISRRYKYGVIRFLPDSVFQGKPEVNSNDERGEAIVIAIFELGLALAIGFSGPNNNFSSAYDTALVKGIREVETGDYQSALVTLGAAVVEWPRDPERRHDLARVHFYMAVAYVGLDQEPLAKAKFEQAMVIDAAVDRSDLSRLQGFSVGVRALRIYTEAVQAHAQRKEPTSKAKSKRWLVPTLLAGAGAVGGAAWARSANPKIEFEAERRNSPPTVTIVSDPSDGAIVCATLVSFEARASDPDGESLSYAWAFGDGVTATGPTVRHVFVSEGTTRAVTVTVADGLVSTTAIKAVTALTMNGKWRATTSLFRSLDSVTISNHRTCNTNSNIPYANFGLTASFGGMARSAAENARVSNPRQVLFATADDVTAPERSCAVFFSGDVYPTLMRITGALQCANDPTNCGACSGQSMPATFARQ
jgi:hypothetical protein